MKDFAKILAAAAAAVAIAAHAQDDDEWADAGGGDFGDEIEAAAKAVSAKKASQPKFFTVLPFCREIEGVVEVLRPQAAAWETAEEGKFYPLGTSYRTVGASSRLLVSFGTESTVEIGGDSSFGTRAQPLGERGRVITLKGGSLDLKLPRNLPDGMFTVSAPGFAVVNLAGDSRYAFENTGDGDSATIRCVTGTLSVSGRHFEILSMRAANEVRIRTSQDVLFTGIYGTRGDYVVRLDQGLIETIDIESGARTVEARHLDWKMSPQTAVRIHRAKPDIGENMAVSVMTFDAAGELANRCVFTENRYEITSGELAPVSKASRDELAKKASEASETETVDVDVGEEDDGGSGDSGSGGDEEEDEEEDEDY